MKMAAMPLGTGRVLALSGRLDSDAVPDLELKCASEVNGETKSLILDLSGLEYLSSAGLRLILTMGKDLQTSGGKLVLCVPQGQTRQIVEAAGFHKLFTVYATVAEASKHATSAFLVHLHKEWEVDVMTVIGRVDAERAPEVESAGRKILVMPYQKLIINLSGVEYLSSAGLCSLLNLMKLAKEKHGRLFVCGPSPAVRQILKMSGFDKILAIRNTVQDAITE